MCIFSVGRALSGMGVNLMESGASDTVRVVRIGKYDECLCAGTHVGHTAEIGTFRITSARYQDGIQRIVFKLNDSLYSTKLVHCRN